MLPLFVDANLDLFVGSLVSPPVQHIANLRDEPPENVHRALAALNWAAPPSDMDLAQQYGDPDAEQVHMGRMSVRRKWLAAWRADERLAWLP